MIKKWGQVDHNDNGKNAVVRYPINVEYDCWAESKGIIRCPAFGQMPLLLVGLYELCSYLYVVEVEIKDD